MCFRTNKALRQVADRIHDAGGKLHSDLMAMIAILEVKGIAYE